MTSPKHWSPKHWPGIICVALIVLVGLLAYSNSLSGAFVFDDETNISKNKAIWGLGSAITDTIHSRVIGYFTFALNYKINGLGVEGYHIFNLTGHLISAILVFWLVLLTLKTPFFKGTRFAGSVFAPLLIALFAGLVFVAHPVQTQAVSYIFQRIASLATLFYLLSFTLYAKWRLAGDGPGEHILLGYRITVDPEVKKGFFYACSLAAALLAMLTKEIAFTLPLVIALWEFSFFKGGAKGRLLKLLPFFLTMPVVPLSLKTSEMPLLSAPGITPVPAATDYLLTQFRVIVTYIRLFFFPVNQNVDYDYPTYQSFFDPNVLLSFILLLAIAGLGVFLWNRSRKGGDYALLRLAAFGIFFFFIALAVESSFIPIADIIFEHRLYLPSVGIIIAVTASVAAAAIVLNEKFPLMGRIVIVLATVIVITLAMAAFDRNRVWSNPLTLWEDTARKSPGKARPHHNLGTIYLETGDLNKGFTELQRAVELQPDDAYIHNSMGAYFLQTGDLEKAEAELKSATDLKQDYPSAHYNLGLCYLNMGQTGKAESEFILVVNQAPYLAEPHFTLGLIYQKSGQIEKAESEYLMALQLNPGNDVAHNNLGNIYMTQKQYEKALAEFKAALRINPDYQEARDSVRLLETRSR